MKIQTVHLKHFNQFQDLTIDLGDNPKRVIALVGPNGVGKTTILSGIASYFLKNTPHESTLKTIFLEDSQSSAKPRPEFNLSFLEHITQEELSSQVNVNPALICFRNVGGYTSFLAHDTHIPITLANSTLKILDHQTDIDQRISNNWASIFKTQKDQDCNVIVPDDLLWNLNELCEICSIHKWPETVKPGSIYFSKNYLYINDDYNSPEFYEFDWTKSSSGERQVLDLLLDLYANKDLYENTIFLFDEPELHLNTSIQRKLLNIIFSMTSQTSQIWIATHSAGIMRALQQEFNKNFQIIELEPPSNSILSGFTIRPITPNFQDWQRVFKTALDDLTYLTLPNKVVLCEGRLYDYQDAGQEGFDGKVYNIIFGKEHPETVFISVSGCSYLDKLTQDLSMSLSQILKKYNSVSLVSLADGDILLNNPKNVDCSTASFGTKASSESQGSPLTTTIKDQITSYITTLSLEFSKGLEDKNNYNNFIKALNQLNNTVNDIRRQDKVKVTKKILNRREIENYLFDPEVLSAFALKNGIEFDLSMYQDLLAKYYKNYCETKNIQPNPLATTLDQIKVAEIKDNIEEIRSLCFKYDEAHQRLAEVDTYKLKLKLAQHLDTEMAVYKELENCIFDKDKGTQSPEPIEQVSDLQGANTNDLKSPSNANKS